MASNMAASMAAKHGSGGIPRNCGDPNSNKRLKIDCSGETHDQLAIDAVIDTAVTCQHNSLIGNTGNERNMRHMLPMRSMRRLAWDDGSKIVELVRALDTGSKETAKRSD